MTAMGARRVAAVDCGTNSLRLLVAEVGPDGLTDVVRRNEFVRLGQGVDRTGLLSPAALERASLTLQDYAREIRETGAGAVRMVATSATRDARNRDEFVDLVRRTLGVEPEVLTGSEEAALSFQGATRGLPDDLPGPYLVVDIGGGSTECVLGTDTAGAAASADIGCVRLAERHLHDDPPTRAQIAAVVADAEAALDAIHEHVAWEAARTLLGLAGTVTTVAGIALDLDAYDARRLHHARIPLDDVRDVTTMLCGADRAQRAAIPVMHPGRVDVIIAGALILRTVVERVGLDAVVASETDILDGVAWTLA